MGRGIGPQGGVVVVADAGGIRCVPSAEVAGILDAAVPFSCSGLERSDRLDAPGPRVVTASLRLTNSSATTQLAARFVAERARRARSTLVLRTYAVGEGTRPVAEVAPIPAAELAGAAAVAGVLVPVGQAGSLRYATTGATLVVTRVAAVGLTARLLVGHRLFMGEAHCPGDALLVAMATGGPADASTLRWALLAHEAVVVAGLLGQASRRAPGLR